MEDNTDALYRYDLATNTVRRFAGVSGTAGRNYDFGDIAVSSTGILYINGNAEHTGNTHTVLDKIDISNVTALTGDTDWFHRHQGLWK